MLSQQAKQTAYARMTIEGLLLCLAFALSFMARSFLPWPFVGDRALLDFGSHFWLLVLAVPLWFLLAARNPRQLLHRGHSGLLVVRSVAIPFVYLGLLLGTAIFLFQAKGFSRAVFFSFLAVGFVSVVGARLLYRAASPFERAGGDSCRNAVIVGLGEEAHSMRRAIESHTDYRMRVVGFLAGPSEKALPDARDVLGHVDDLKRVVEDRVVDDVLFILPPARLLECERQISWCEEVGVTVHLKIDFVRTLISRTYPSELDGTPMLTLSPTPYDALALLVKQILDITVSATALILASPLMLAAALAIKLTSRGPIFFAQPRVGLNGREFRLYKFRSMYRDAETRRAELERLNEMSGPVFKIRNDPRITPVGRLLRRFSIDELPQLWNVLRGDMSLVGPRPPLPAEVRQYQRWQRRRLSMKPGVTCLWQVNGRNRISFDDWMRLDLEYIDTWSLGLDLKILLRTVPAVVFARGAH